MQYNMQYTHISVKLLSVLCSYMNMIVYEMKTTLFFFMDLFIIFPPFHHIYVQRN